MIVKCFLSAGGPVDKAGVLDNWGEWQEQWIDRQLSAVNGRPVRRKNKRELLDYELFGPVGSTVELTISHLGNSVAYPPKTYTLTKTAPPPTC